MTISTNRVQYKRLYMTSKARSQKCHAFLPCALRILVLATQEPFCKKAQTVTWRDLGYYRAPAEVSATASIHHHTYK